MVSKADTVVPSGSYLALEHWPGLLVLSSLHSKPLVPLAVLGSHGKLLGDDEGLVVQLEGMGLLVKMEY